MEVEDLGEQVEREAPQIAAAFGIKEWTVEIRDEHFVLTGMGEGLISMTYHWPYEGHSFRLWVGDQDVTQTCIVNGQRVHLGQSNHNVLTARGLYRLGFEDAVLSQLPQLTAHEKLELRLSMPREFWPQKWFNEEKETSVPSS